MDQSEYSRVIAELSALLEQKLHVQVPAQDADLFESGILDSQKFVELLLHIEQRFATQVTAEDFEIENFRCLDKIAALIMRHKDAARTNGDPAAAAMTAKTRSAPD
jgi:D-alanine--poly(phosphoribitol) ligase subunit 2